MSYTSHDSESTPFTLPLSEVKTLAAALANDLRSVPGESAAGGGSKHRGLPPEVHARFVTVRSALYQRGIYDPVLVRFDSATAPTASNAELAEQLATIAEAL
jgi:hypothetical protein